MPEETKIEIEINGVSYTDDEIDNFIVIYEQGLTRISLNVHKAENSKTPSLQSTQKNVKMSEPVLGDITESKLSEEHLQVLDAKSPLRMITIEESNRKDIQAISIESNEFDILNTNCLNDAIESLIKKEQEYAQQGYALISTVQPLLIKFAPNGQYFHIIEEIVIARCNM
jgi:hypothetical protein